MIRKNIIALALLICSTGLFGQKIPNILAVVAKSDYSAEEWIIYTDDENITGSLMLTYPGTGDLSQWSYRIGEFSGSFRAPDKRNMNLWETRGDNYTYTCRPIWSNNPYQWKITDNNQSLELKAKGNYAPEHWISKIDNKIVFEMLTHTEGDPRGWDVYDDLNEEWPLPARMSLICLVLIHSAFQ